MIHVINYVRQGSILKLTVLIVSILGLGGFLLWSSNHLSADTPTSDGPGGGLVDTDVVAPSSAATTTFPLAVSGVVQAQQSIVVRAERDGVIDTVAVEAGESIAGGMLLFTQALPVAVAQAAAAKAQADVARLEARIEADQAQQQAEQKIVREQSARDLAQLRLQSATTEVAVAGEALRPVLEQALVTILSTLDFMNQQPRYFSLTEQELYQAVIQDIYGGLPNYLVGSFRFPINQPDDLRAVLEATDAMTADELVGVATAIDAQLAELQRVMQLAEPEVFAANDAVRTDQVITEYVKLRTELVETQTAVRSAYGAVWQRVDGLSEVARIGQTEVDIAGLDRERQVQLAAWQDQLAASVAAAAAVETGVARARLQQGSVVAAWDAVVQAVHVDPGEFVSAGTPIAQLYSQQGREMVARVPLVGTDMVSPGDTFFVGSTAVGVVDRVATEASQARRTIYITITDDSIALGAVIHGHLTVPVAAGYELLDRKQIVFRTAGPYRTQGGDVVPVDIIRDLGATVLVRSR